MEAMTDRLADAAGLLRGILSDLRPADLDGRTGEQLLELAGGIEAAGRAVDALRIMAAGQIEHASRPILGGESLARRHGCVNAADLLERVTLCSRAEARRRLRIGAATRPRTMFSTGEALPAEFDPVRHALATGALGRCQAEAIIQTLTPVLCRYPTDDLDSFRSAERALVCSALGVPADDTSIAEPPLCADGIRLQAQLWAVALDPDGAEPSARQWAARAVRLHPERDGLIPIDGLLLPEVAAKLQTALNSMTNPRQSLKFMTAHERAALDTEQPRDDRTLPQRRHDALATIIDIAARSGGLPTLNGAAPTPVITVLQRDLDTGAGAGFADGLATALPMAAVRQAACADGVQQVILNPDGSIAHVGPEERTFTGRKRRALEARDGGCIIPGCPIPAWACEAHHVTPYATDRRTRVDNGVLLCWYHHRTIDTSGWKIKMIAGVPHVMPPPHLGSSEWRVATTSRARHLAGIRSRITPSRRDTPVP